MNRSEKIIVNKNLVFQILDWYTIDLENELHDEESDEIFSETKYIIKLFGVTQDGHSVSVNVLDWTPYFFISGNKRFKNYEISQLKFTLKGLLPKKFKNDLIDIISIDRKSIWGFTNNEKQQYLKLIFTNSTTMSITRNKLMKMNKYKFHETNIDPFLRFIHFQNIKPSGWISISDYDINEDILPSKCQINISTQWKNIIDTEVNSMAPFIIASFDIECTSSHGDFPVAIKTYNKSAKELLEYYNSNNDNINIKELILDAVKSLFKLHDEQILSVVYTKTKINENTILKHFDDIYNILIDAINPNISKTSQLEDKFNKIFPKIHGDPIIQIGTTFHKYGDSNCYYKNIITLGTCSDINNVDVIQCNTEEEVLLQWTELINRIDPDIITGYNILGFDFNYMYSRSLELNCQNDFMSCGRLEDTISEFKEKMLSSSALGDNCLKYINMEGRVIFDMMKIVQKDHKLDTYKLDNVASTFIKGKVLNKENNYYITDNISGLNIGSYIHINDQKEKYIISDIIDNKFKINYDGDVKSWGLAKDDVTPQEIFECQKGDENDRAKIAKYCVQDCSLCNILTIKLEIVANNIGMSNVCFVPLSYIFMRGQGIKIFSLVAKQCKEDGYIIPLIKYDEENENDDGYEGAIVLEPQPGVYVNEPISVMDYASLYPSSMISENISHDTIVLNEKYNNLPGYDYVDITYDIYTGTGDKKKKTGEKVCRYVQFPNGEKGILPRILMKLLSQRKATRKKATEKLIITKDNKEYKGLITKNDDGIKIGDIFINNDNIDSIKDLYNDFMKAVLDGLQLAYKITANSLYGQVGAKTSQIYMKELAASTTATGRNLILKAKSFVEKNYDAKVVYGDSVLPDEPIVIRNIFTKHIEVIQIQNLHTDWYQYESFKHQGYLTYIKHILIKVLVDGTDSPNEIYGLVNALPLFLRNQIISKQLISKNNKYIYYEESHDIREEIDIYLSYFEKDTSNRFDKEESLVNYEIWTDHEWQRIKRVIRHKTTKNIYSISTGNGIVNVTEDHSLCDIYKKPIKPKQLSFDDILLHHDFNIDITNFIEEISVEQAWLYGIYTCYGGDEEWSIKHTDINYLIYIEEKLIENEKSNFQLVNDTILTDDTTLFNKYKIFKELIPKNILNANKNIREAFFKGINININLKNINKTVAQGLYVLANTLGEKLYFTGEDYINNNIVKHIENDYVYDIETITGRFNAGIGSIILFNTDSIFVDFKIKEKYDLTGKEALQKSIDIAVEASDGFKGELKKPHDLEYEKTFWPFIILSKKKYVGNLYEFDVNKFKQKSMGIVLKRRDNANIVKIIYGGIIDILLNKHDVKMALEFLKESLNKLISGTFPMEDLIITKTLRGSYADPTRIAHKVLADRMKQRDPGSAPQVNDRIPFVYIYKKEKNILQGERIEHPNYIIENNITPDYTFYISNQLMKPISQLIALVLEQIDGYSQRNYDIGIKNMIDKKKILDYRQSQVQKIIFDPILKKIDTERSGFKTLDHWFKKI